MNNNQAVNTAPKRRKRFSFKDLEKAPFITEAMAILVLSILLFTGENDKIATEIILSVGLLASSLLLFVQYVWNKRRFATVGFSVCFTAYTVLYSWLFKAELGAFAAVYIVAALSFVVLTALHAIPFFARRPYWLWFGNYIPAALLVLTGMLNFRGIIGGTSVFAFKVFIEAVVFFLLGKSLQYPVRIPEKKMHKKLEIERLGNILSIISLVLTVIFIVAASILIKSFAEPLSDIAAGIDLSKIPAFPLL